VAQFLNGRRNGPIGMSEEKDEATAALEQSIDDDLDDVRGVVPQLRPTPGQPPRRAAARRQERVMRILHELPPAARQGILASLDTREWQHERSG
jgi:phospholipid/cholesterol/gamma-HCH transport system ATP-binding protein